MRSLPLNRSKLQQASNTSALLSGFALVAMVELDLPTEDGVSGRYHNHGVIVAFAVVTALTIAVHLFALMVSTCILPYLELQYDRSKRRTGVSLPPRDDVMDGKGVAAHVARTASASMSASHAAPTAADTESSEEYTENEFGFYMEVAWIFSTGLGILFFIVDLALLSYIKFVAHSPVAGWAAIAVLVPVACVFLWFTVIFYHKVVKTQTAQLATHAKELQQLADMLADTKQGPRASVQLDDVREVDNTCVRRLSSSTPI